MPVRNTDTDEHEIQCHTLHHEHSNRLAILETKVQMNKDALDNSVTELILRQSASEEKFDKTFQAFLSTLTGIEIKMEKYMSKLEGSISNSDKWIKYITPIMLAIFAGFWALYTHK